MKIRFNNSWKKEAGWYDSVHIWPLFSFYRNNDSGDKAIYVGWLVFNIGFYF